MAYIGQSIKNGTFSVLDTSGNTYNGSNTTFSLGTQVGSPAQLLVSHDGCLLYTSPSPRDGLLSRMPSSA